MKINSLVSSGSIAIEVVALTIFAHSVSAGGLTPDTANQIKLGAADRVESLVLLGGDASASGGAYAFKGDNQADLNITKFGGRGDMSDPKPLGLWGMDYNVILMGNFGYIDADTRPRKGILSGDCVDVTTYAVQLGGGVRLYPTKHLSFAPTINGIWGRTDSKIDTSGVYHSIPGNIYKWDVSTWTVSPGMEGRYEWTWGRTAFEWTTAYTYFHTESFNSSVSGLIVNGDSQTVQNKLDVDVPLGIHLFGQELHTGGFISRTELIGDVKDGLESDHIYMFNGRLVMDLLGKLWKVQWLGLGGTYFRGENFDGWAIGADVRFKF